MPTTYEVMGTTSQGQAEVLMLIEDVQEAEAIVVELRRRGIRAGHRPQVVDLTEDGR
jgi:hypothetical protein